LGLTILWTMLVGIIAAGIYVPMRTFEPAIERVAPGSWSAAIAIYMLAGLFLSFAFPAAWPLSFAVMLLMICIVTYVRTHDPAPALLWKSRQSQQMSAIPLTRLAAFIIGSMAIAIIATIITAAGTALLARPEGEGTMPITVWLGSLSAWFVPGLVAVVVVGHWSLRSNDPARRTPATLNLITTITMQDLQSLKSLFNGWRLAMNPKPEPVSVCIAIVDAKESQAREFEPTWPLKVTLEDLKNDIVRDRLTRRDELQLRRLGFRGLAKLFKKTGKGSTGDGYLFAPHWWFIDGIGREADSPDESDDEIGLQSVRRVGQSYDSVLPPRVRQHWHAVLRATQLDLMFIEDGVKPKSIEKVLRQILTYYDRSAGKRAMEDVHFNGIPKVKCMVHEYGLGESFDAGNGDYPEPKFMELTRARVLHIFKDRGDQRELDDIPFDMSWEPSPLAMV
jgi:hypothetical protein